MNNPSKMNEIINKLLEKCKKIVLYAYDSVLLPNFKLSEKLGRIKVQLDKDLKSPAYSKGDQIYLKTIKSADENKLLLFHEILHILFTNKKVLDSINSIRKKYSIVDEDIFQKIMDAFIDKQIDLFTSFGSDIWDNLKRPKTGKFVKDTTLNDNLEQYIETNNINSNLVNLEGYILSFLETNKKVIIKACS